MTDDEQKNVACMIASGWERLPNRLWRKNGLRLRAIAFTTDANAALTLCDALATKGFDLVLSSRLGTGRYSVTFAAEPDRTFTAQGDSLQLAIVDAFLKTIGKAES